MTGMKKRDGDSEVDSGFITPDSTTKEKVSRFCEGEDVLSHGKDGLFYLGTIVVVDLERERCLVQFEDSTAHWSLYKDITKLRIPESDELCVICKSSRSYSDNEIVLCSLCSHGYHQNCLKPVVSNEYCDSESQWECPRCSVHSAHQKEERKRLRGNSSPRKQKPAKAPPPEDDCDGLCKVTLPYQPSALMWDAGHKSNREQTYCYCGGPGEWYNRMLQCHRCRQWYHEACVECLHQPLLYGDRYYVFICSICNEGCEFVHRLDVKWVDVVHIALFNLTLQESKVYFEFDTSITQWITDNWELLQCPIGLQRVRVNERKLEVNRILRFNRNRFRCGKDSRKKASQWGLRVKVPPPIPTVTLPRGVITEESIKQFTVLRKTSPAQSPPLRKLVKIKDGKDPQSGGFSPNVRGLSPAKKRPYSHSSPPSPFGEEEEWSGGRKQRRKRKKELDILMEDKKAKKMIDELTGGSPPIEGEPPLREDIRRKRGRPPKKAEEDAPQVLHKKIGTAKCLRESQRKNSGPCREGSDDIGSGNFKTTKVCSVTVTSLGAPLPGGEDDTSGDDTSSHGTLESFIPPPSNFEGQNHPFLNMDLLGYTSLPTVRPLKRKLKESDIKIGKNGEVKRKRLRRKLDVAKVVYVSHPNNSMFGNTSGGPTVATHLSTLTAFAKPAATPGPGGLASCMDYSVNGGLPALPRDPVSLNDLKNTMNSYFGAADRLSSGQKFRILAKRTNKDHRIQYLIEWDNNVPATTVPSS